MKRWINIVSQIVLGSAQVYQLFEPAIPAETKPLVAGGIGVAQLVISALAHGYNPDGTPAIIPYVKGLPPVK